MKLDWKQNKNRLYSIMIFLLVIVLCLFLFNEWYSFTHAVRLVQDPCGVCVEQRPEFLTCANDIVDKANANANPPKEINKINWSSVNITQP